MNDHPREATRLRRQLRAFVSQAQENERKLQRFLQQELAFMAAGGLPELLRELFTDYPARFALDAVTLQLMDPAHEIRHILQELALLPDPRLQLVASVPGETPTIFLGPVIPQQAQAHFPDDPEIRSMARLPLTRQSRLIGVLALGSHQPERFITGSATDFMARLATVLAVCIENALNHERIKRLGLVDALTGLHNRRYFDARLVEEISHARRTTTPLCCLYIDIDHFKQINDQYGHARGDQILQWLANTLKSQMRRNDVLARLGGEEFAVLLTETEPATAMDIAERIRLAVAHGSRAGLAFPVTISIGVSTLDDDALAPDRAGQCLLHAADQGLYQAKRSGRNRIVFQPDPAPDAV